MSKRFDSLISNMTSNLEPVRPYHPVYGLGIVGFAWVFCAAVFLIGYGPRADFLALRPHDLALLVLLMSAGLCAMTSWYAVRMALPAVGRESSAWHGAVLITVAIPVAGLVVSLDSPRTGITVSTMNGAICMIQGVLTGLGVGSALTLWLRKGAPTSAHRAGLIVGLATGSAGATIVALHCPENTLGHIGLWHGFVVLLCMGAGGVCLPRLMRW